MSSQPLRCPQCKAERLKATGKVQGMYDDRVELECRKCGHVWMSTSAKALPLLHEKREER